VDITLTIRFLIQRSTCTEEERVCWILTLDIFTLQKTFANGVIKTELKETMLILNEQCVYNLI